MGTRLQGGFYSVKNNDHYVIKIEDSEFSGTATAFNIEADGLSIDFDHQDKGINTPILTQKAKLSLVVENSTIEGFISDLVNSAEGRFILLVERNGEKEFIGYILADLVNLDDLPYAANPILTVEATDGLARLKKIPYSDDGDPYLGLESFLAHIFRILEKVGFQGYYIATEPYLTTYVNWYADEHNYSANSDPLALSRFDHKALIKVDRSGEVVFKNCFDVLTEILVSWHARLMFSQGHYKLIQVPAYQTDGATKVLKVYDVEQTVSLSSTTDLAPWNKTTSFVSLYRNDTADNFHFDGLFRYYPAFREVLVNYLHYSNDNLIPGAKFNQTSAEPQIVANIDYNSGVARLAITGKVESRIDWESDEYLQVATFWFKIRVQVGDYYLSRGYQLVNGQPKLNPYFEWTETPSYVDYFTEYMYADNGPRFSEIGFVTPTLPAGGQMTFDIDRFGALNSLGEQIFTGEHHFTAYWDWLNTSVQLYVEGNLDGQTIATLYTADNPSGSTNSETQELTILFGDGPSSNTFGAIQVYDDVALSWLNSTGWRVGNSGAFVEFGQLLADSLLASQKLPIPRYIGNITGDYRAHNRLQRVAGATIVNYVFVAGKYNVHKDTWSGEWVAIDVDFTGLATIPPRKFVDFGVPFGDIITKPTFPKLPPGILDTPGATNPPITTTDIRKTTPVRIITTERIPKDLPITKIDISGITIPGIIYKGDIIKLETPTGNTIPVRVTADVLPGAKEVSIEPLTPDFDIPPGSVLGTPEEDLFTYVQASRIQQLRFFSDLRASGEISTDPLYFFRIDHLSSLYLSEARTLELQVLTPGGGAGSYKVVLKRDTDTLVNETVDETATLERFDIYTSLSAGLYTLQLSSITGETPVGVNFILNYLNPLIKNSYIDPDAPIYGAYPGDKPALADNVPQFGLYTLTVDNYSGVAEGLVIQLYPTVHYISDSLAAVADDEYYSVSAGNAYGAPFGAVRVKNYTGTTYLTDALASAGGIAEGERYVLANGNPYTMVSGFVKIRTS